MSTVNPVPTSASLGTQIMQAEKPVLIAPADQLLSDIEMANGDLAKDAAAVAKFLAVENANMIPAFGALSTLAVRWLHARADAWLAKQAPLTPAKAS